MTSRVSDAKEDKSIMSLSQIDRLGIPKLPRDGIVHMASNLMSI